MLRPLDIAACCLLASGLLLAQDTAAPTFEEHWKQATAAYRAKDHAAYLEHMLAAAKLRPDSLTVTYNLAGAQALAGHPKEALEQLGRLADKSVVFDAAADEDFASIRDSDGFKGVLARFEKLEAPIGKSDVAFKLPQKDLITEGVAYDPAAETFYVGSIHQRKIVSRGKDGSVKDFATAEDGLWSVFGMKVDAKRRALWVCTTVTPQMVGFKKEDEGLSSVLRFDLASGEVLKRYDLPNRPQAHWLGDLVVDSKGNVFVTDSQAPGAVYAIFQKDDALVPWIEPGPFRSPQGIDLATDEKHVFVADYSMGILRFDVASKQSVRVTGPADLVLAGIDGLYVDRDGLIAIQNGIRPHRVVRYRLNASQDRIERAEILEMNSPLFDEPTLGVLVGDELYYVANSQWSRFDKDGTIFPMDKLQEPVILRAALQ
jgi:sugar lactone lactonase YvrE